MLWTIHSGHGWADLIDKVQCCHSMHALEPILNLSHNPLYHVQCNNLSAVLYFQYGWTALLWACDNSHADVVDFLLQHGADIDAQDVCC